MLLSERYKDKIKGILSCYDRIVIHGNIPELCFDGGMTSYLYQHQVKIFDYPDWANTWREELRAHAEQIARDNGLEIEFIRKLDAFRKDDRIQAVIESRGTHPGLVHIFSAMETCTSYKPWHDKQTGKTFVKNDSGKCLHYYFYFIDPDFGLCYLRVPTWCPFRLQFYMNGHNWFASRLAKQQIAFKMKDNAFLGIADWGKAQQLSDHIRVEDLSVSKKDNDRRFKGFNFFSREDRQLFQVLAHGKFNINGLQNKSIRALLPHLSSASVSRILKRLRVHGMVKKVPGTRKYYLTKLGKSVITLGLKTRELVIIPGLSEVATA